MKCLHICNDLLGSKVHDNLYSELSNLDIEQTVFYPQRKHSANKVPEFVNTSQYAVKYSPSLKKIHRIFFRRKTNFLYRSLKRQIDLNEIDIVHATTLYSDGAIALKLYEEYQIPYILAIRGTDINLFLKLRPDLNGLVLRIIKNASKLVFISNSLMDKFLSKGFIASRADEIRQKSILIYNGIDPFWIENTRSIEKPNPRSILYIGRFDNNKNVLKLIEAVSDLRIDFPDLELNLVGKGGKQEEMVVNKAQMVNWINYHGPIYDKHKLMEIFRSNHIFAMISIGETFGLVYLEALSQGLPVICSKNQGIDGVFDQPVGEFVDPRSNESIVSGIKEIVENYERYSYDIDFTQFVWPKIAKRYHILYGNVLSTNNPDKIT